MFRSNTQLVFSCPRASLALFTLVAPKAACFLELAAYASWERRPLWTRFALRLLWNQKIVDLSLIVGLRCRFNHLYFILGKAVQSWRIFGIFGSEVPWVPIIGFPDQQVSEEWYLNCIC